MNQTKYPLVIECDALQNLLNNDDIVIIDLCKKEAWVQAHIPNAVHLHYAQIIHIQKPVMGLLPEAAEFSNVLAALGVNNDSHIIAYDDEGGGKASRLLWTLEAFGFSHYSLLNGGLIAWANEGYPVTTEVKHPETGTFSVTTKNNAAIAERDYVLENLNNDSVKFLDARSTPEFTGQKCFAQRGGHIPGAIHYDWLELMEPTNNARLRSAESLNATLSNKGFDKEKEVVCYCHTHHRSALSFVMLKSLGYNKLRGYPGSWSDWGNIADTPIEN